MLDHCSQILWPDRHRLPPRVLTLETQIFPFFTIMFDTARVFLLAVLLSNIVTPITAFDFVTCFHEDYKTATFADCRAVVDMIPNGKISWDGKTQKPLNFYLPPAARQFTTPAVFRSGSCLVYIYTRNRVAHPGPRKGASELYFKFWPEVKESAERILKKCFLNGNNAGQEFIDVVMEDTEYKYEVVMSAAPADMPKHGEKWLMGEPYNVYDTAGDSGASSSRAAGDPGASSSKAG